MTHENWNDEPLLDRGLPTHRDRRGEIPESRVITVDPLATTSLEVQAVPAYVYDRVKAQGHCSNHGGNLWTSADPMDMAVALADCQGCPVTQECLQVIQPSRCWFDGVCGAQAWLHGRPVNVTPLGQTADPNVPVQRPEAEPDLLTDRLTRLRPPRPE